VDLAPAAADDETVDAERAETYLRMLAEAELRLASPSRHDRRPARVWLAVTALVAAGGIDTETVRRVLADLDDAVALRPGTPPGVSRIAPPYWLARVRPQQVAGPAGPGVALCAVPAGVTLPLLREHEGLHVLAGGWQPSGWGWLAFGGGRLEDGPPDPPVSWQVRDSTGRWHMVEQMNWGDGGSGVTQIQALLTPPLHPSATWMEVIITGVSSRVRVTVPLRWQPA
jgi:hypothetical protein